MAEPEKQNHCVCYIDKEIWEPDGKMTVFEKLETEKQYFINSIITEQSLQIEAKLGLDKRGDKVSKVLS